MTPKHIHIVGCLPRSGTTLMTTLMINCFDIDGYTDHENSIFRKYHHPYRILCTKKPNDIKYIDFPLRINKALHVIYLQRDPRDAISSRSHQVAVSGKKLWGNLRTWLDHQRIAERLASITTRFIVVRYEDLVTNPDQVQLYLQEKLPFLRIKVKFSEYHTVAVPSEKAVEALGSFRPISSSSVGSWRNHKPYIKAQIEKYGDLTQALIHLGYEDNSNWMAELQGVYSDNSDENLKTKFWYQKLWKQRFILPRRRLLYRLFCSRKVGD